MRCKLLREVPLLDGSLEALTDRDRLDVDVLADLEVSGTDAVADRQEVFWCYLELDKVFLGWQIMLQIMAGLRFWEVF